MTNEEKAKELGKKYARQYHHNKYPEFSSNSEFVFSNEEIEKACNEMAEWKEKQLKEQEKRLLDVFETVVNLSTSTQEGYNLAMTLFRNELINKDI